MVLDFVFAIITSLMFVIVTFTANFWFFFVLALGFLAVAYLFFKTIRSIREFRACDTIKTRKGLVRGISFILYGFILEECIMILLFFTMEVNVTSFKALRLMRSLGMNIRLGSDSGFWIFVTLIVNIIIIRRIRWNVNSFYQTSLMLS